MKLFKSKIGTARKQPGSRVWLQGSRLAAAGFVPGAKYGARWYERQRKLLLTLKYDGTYEERTVSGKGDTPIIDITGDRVREFFGSRASHVEVTFSRGSILIMAAAA